MVNPDEAASATPSSSATHQAQAVPAQQNITVTNRQLNKQVMSFAGHS